MDSDTIKGQTPEQIDAAKLMEAIKSLVEAVADMVKTIAETVKAIINAISAMWEEFLCTYAFDRRVAHLAKHSKKRRIRKKNLSRLNVAFVRWMKAVNSERRQDEDETDSV